MLLAPIPILTLVKCPVIFDKKGDKNVKLIFCIVTEQDRFTLSSFFLFFRFSSLLKLLLCSFLFLFSSCVAPWLKMTLAPPRIRVFQSNIFESTKLLWLDNFESIKFKQIWHNKFFYRWYMFRMDIPSQKYPLHKTHLVCNCLRSHW